MTGRTFVHKVGEQPKQFDTLYAALGYVSDKKFTGYIVDPDGAVINIRKGKRKAVDGKWICP
jgi:hypothetical protein